ncbi:MAG: type II toxin-antitoxin system HicB family antitoxin [Fimbriimonadaceae bacterium]|nr:type II toxin-antitoxin system HicB family antitoxin [Fimbriimonadaceae bacterium]
MTDFPIILELEDDGRYSASAPDLPGCYSWGATREQALDHIREAIEVWIESAKADGDPIPKPGSSLAYVRVVG